MSFLKPLSLPFSRSLGVSSSSVVGPGGGAGRTFAAAAAAAAAAGGIKNRVRTVVVGSGRMGQIRASILQSNPKFDLVGIVDTNVHNAEILANKYEVKSYADAEEAIQSNIADGRPLNGMVVSTPTFTHDSIIRTAGSHGVDVFAEKPVDETADKIEMLYEYANIAGIRLCCGFQRRFDPSYAKATNAVMQGQIGTPIMSNIFFADHPSPPREFLLQGGNIFMDLSAHDVDYITHTLQDDVVSVYATGTSSDDELARAGVHDNATMVMNFRNGAVVTLFMSRSSTYGYDQRCEIFGTDGLVSVQNVHDDVTVVSNSAGVHRSKLEHSFPQRFHTAFSIELDEFANTVLLGTEWPVSGEQCVKVQQVADAARQSAQTGEVVNIQSFSGTEGTSIPEEPVIAAL